MVRDLDPFHIVLWLQTALVLIAAPLLAAAGVSMPVCLLVVMLAPAISVIGYELRGHRRISEALERRHRLSVSASAAYGRSRD